MKLVVQRLLVLIGLMVLLIPHIGLSVNAETSSEWYDSGEFRSTTYYRTYLEWIKTYQVISNVNLEVKVEDAQSCNPSISTVSNDLYNGLVYAPAKEEKVTYVLNVSKAGLYYLALDYLYDTEYSSNPTIDLFVNGKNQYNETEQLNLNVLWESIDREEDAKYNRYGDELLPYSVPVREWNHNFISDCFNESNKPNLVLLNAGENNITVQVHDDNLLLGSIYIEQLNNAISYDEYINSYTDKQTATDTIIIQAQDIDTKNNVEVKSSYYKSYKMTPNSYKTQVLNMLSGSSMSRSGTSVTYEFNVENDGLYELSFKYKQSSLAGLSVGKNIYIDGEIPFAELEDYLFPYARKWINYTLNDGTNNYKFYLTSGTHYLTIESTSEHVVEILDKLYTVMDTINSIGITINTITGSSSNTQITWKITNYLPNISDDLLEMASILDECYDTINSFDSSTKEASEVTTLKVASKQLKRLAKSPNKIQNRLSELSEGSGSAYQLIGSAIGYLINQTLDIDYICMHSSSYKMDRPNGNIFGRFWFSLKSFVYSFFDERYNIKLSDDAYTIDVMVGSSSLYTNIMQEMIDDEFTKETGIKVNLNILSNSQAIILNNATNTNPDVILDVDSWLPYTYALRGMLEDLSKYDGFNEVTKDIYSSNFTPLIYEDGVYGLPATQGMTLMFYRTDILESLGLSAPSTWEDVLNMLPTLQSYQMNFYHPLGADSAYKGFGQTSPFFYLFGAEMYTSNGFTSNLNDESSVSALKFMTDLFNVYNLPQQVSSFFEHFRSGTLPIGIGGIDLYLQLKYACPELAGQWDVLPIPGMLNTDTGEVERWTTTYGKCSIMFSASEKKDNAWKFLSWWHNEATQLEYVQKIKSYLGEKYLIVPANINALNASPWDYEIKSQVAEAARWSRIPAITPGSYIVEREISNIWNKVVIEKINVRVAVNQSIPKINRELSRKFEEFKYLKNGIIVKEYIVPTNDNIQNWVKGREYYE